MAPGQVHPAALVAQEVVAVTVAGVVLGVTVDIMGPTITDTRQDQVAWVVLAAMAVWVALAAQAALDLLVVLVALVLPWEMQLTFFRRVRLTLPVSAGLAVRASVPPEAVALVEMVGMAMLEAAVAMGV